MIDDARIDRNFETRQQILKTFVGQNGNIFLFKTGQRWPISITLKKIGIDKSVEAIKLGARHSLIEEKDFEDWCFWYILKRKYLQGVDKNANLKRSQNIYF